MQYVQDCHRSSVLLGVLAASQATADTIALKADAVGIATNSNNFTFGWAFHVSSEITVSQLVVVRKLAFWLEAGSIDKRSPGENRAALCRL